MFIIKQIVYKNTLPKFLSKKYSDYVKVLINNEDQSFPNVWLRDNCQCQQCFHPSAKSRTLDWSCFDMNTKPKKVKQNNDSLHIDWEDGHISKYNLQWLKLRSFKEGNKKFYNDNIYKPQKSLWNGEQFTDICSEHDYNEILKLDNALYDWLLKLSIYGVALIKNTPNTDTALDSIVKRVGFPKKTHYGEKFIVKHVNNTSNVAYLSNNLQMHNDLPYYEYCPGVNMLHCTVQTESKGGENLLSDCHYVANYMKENHPDQYKLLTDVEIEWSDVGIEDGNEFHKLYRSPIICLDRHNEIIRINFSVPQRGSNFPGNIDLVKPWYEAHSLFLKLNHKFSAKFKTQPGNILVFDNIRLLHGRNGYEDKLNNVRKLIGAYVDWDEIYSRIRCLKVKMNKVSGI